MAGGTWNAQNKVLPGVYINFKAAPTPLYQTGERGVVAICEPLSWGPVAAVTKINAGEDTMNTLGFDVNTAPELLFLREIFRGTNRSAGAKTVLLYRPTADSSAAAKATIGPMTVTAKYHGTRGNAVSISVSENVNIAGVFTVTTMVDGAIADRQEVTEIKGLAPNAWVAFSGTGAPTAATATPLTGGEDGTVAAAAYSAFLTAVEPYQFDVVAYDGTDTTILSAFTAFVKRLRDSEGRKCQAVVSGLTGADSEAVINVYNGVVLPEKTLTKAQTVWWVAGATAGATYSQALTYAAHPIAVDVLPRLTNTQMAEALQTGNFAMMEEYGTVKTLSDRNTLTTFSADKSQAFSKNRVIRVLDAIANDIYATFSKYHIGQTENNAVGRDLLKKEIVGYINQMQANNGVQNFTADDVSVLPGNSSDSVVIELAVQPVDSIEKIYMTVTVS